MKILVTGAAGLLGSHVAAMAAQEHDVAALDRNRSEIAGVTTHVGDMRSEAFCARVVADFRPDAVIHCAAMTDVNACERDPEQAYAMNAAVTASLARLMADRGAMVYVSTDSVFAGDSAFHPETEAPSPSTVYAKSKLEGERQASLAGRTVVVRTNFFGWSSGRKTTFGEWLVAGLESGASLTLYTDAYFTPIYVVDLARRLLALAAQGLSGTYHAGGDERLSKHDFGLRLAAAGSWPTTGVRPGRLEERNDGVRRPKDMSLDSTALVSALRMPTPSLEKSLVTFLRDRQKTVAQRCRS